MKRKTALRLVREELDRAQSAFPPMASPHEGYAILREEVDELWTEIKDGNGRTDRGVSEAVQSAAMALRYLIDLCDDPAAEDHEQKVEEFLERFKERATRSDGPRPWTGGATYSG